MNNNYFSSSFNDYSYEYPSPSMPTYYYSPSTTSCPAHSPYSFYSSLSQSMHVSPTSYPYYQQQERQPVQLFSSSILQHINIPTNIDRTPLRQHQCFKKNELQILHQIYNQDFYPSNDVLQQLAIQFEVSIDKVRQWFKNRRHSDKLKKKQTTARTSITS